MIRQLWPERPSSGASVLPLPKLGREGVLQIVTHLDHLMVRVLQCILYGTALEDYPKTPIGPECSSMGSDGHNLVCLCNISASLAVLLTSLLLRVIQGADCYP